ncbi:MULTISPECIES: carbohydrate ABC transporter permease [unclassified Haladaptatus]|uniref:carbohydrate ABC transporter permease n=1 Tax=unclassified Haladaptatus TaxID=2622732 RepID=UPI00209C32EA|nr:MULTISPECIES: carbohydrate ABC transporter permease [unclassified Haladaptatus]MCO8243568.1 carbohydrate ABC transporter permease [Haladaptatus sp. AB643]MCO8254977.1 carbohydrate ABC transporter permease [Haladaptatus sp. AB618]
MSVIDRLIEEDVESTSAEHVGAPIRRRVATFVVLAAGSVAILVPLYWMVATSLKPAKEVGRFPPSIVPIHFTIAPYVEALQQGMWGTWLFNTAIISAGTTILTLAIAIPAAYSLARKDFPGAKPLYVMFLGILMVPAQILLIPLYVLFVKLHLVNTRIGLMLAYATFFLGFSVFLLHSFFTNLPKNLEDAARIGGISEWKIFLRVILPLAKPGLATTGVFLFVFTWNEFLFALTFLQGKSLYTISVGLQTFQGNHGSVVYNQLFAMSTLSTIPVILVFAFFSEQFIQGIAGLEMQ